MLMIWLPSYAAFDLRNLQHYDVIICFHVRQVHASPHSPPIQHHQGRYHWPGVEGSCDPKQHDSGIRRS